MARCCDLRGDDPRAHEELTVQNWVIIALVELVAWMGNGFHFDAYGALILLFLMLGAMVQRYQQRTMRDELRERRLDNSRRRNSEP
jgi:hypothetical protein